VTLSAGGSIVQSGTSSITANAITLNSENGNAGTSDNPLEVNVVADGSTPGNLSVVTQNGGAAYITNASNSVALENVSTAGDFSLSSPGDITVNAGSTAVNVSSTFGGVTLLLTGTGNISINGGVTAGGGPVVIENDDTTTGTIQVADDVTISGVGRIFDYQATPSIQSLSGVQLLSGPFPGSVTQGTISNDVNVFVSGSQVTSLPATAPTVYFGAGVTATATAVVNVSNGANVVFGTTDASSISLGSGVTINADAVVQAISSLDLSKSSVVSGMISLIQQGNAGVSGTLTATGGTVTFAPTVSLTNLSAFNVPAKFTVQFSNFDSNNPVVVNVPQSATANPVINGTVLFTGDGSFQSNGSLFINSNSSASKSVVLTMGSTGKLSSDNNLRMNVGGLVKIAGDLTYGAYNTFELFTGGANPGTSTAAPGTVTLSSTSSITTATAAANAQLTIRSGGSIVQSSGSQLTATNMLLAVGGINAGSSPASQIVANGVNAASLILIAGSGSSVSLLQGSKSSVSLVAVLAQHSTVSLSQAAALSLFGTTLGSLTASSSTGLTVVSDLGCGNCTFTTPSLAVNDAAVSTNRASGTVSISSSGALSVTGMNGSIFSSQQTSVKSGTARSITLSGIALTAETGNLSVTAGGALTIDGAILSAGALVDPFHLGVLLPSDLGSAGSIVISAKGITTTDTTVLQTSGGSISMTSTSSLVLNGQYSAQGGNIVVLARSSVSGTNPQLLANAIGTISTNSKGGGIEVGSGLTTSTKLSAAMLLAPGTVPRSPVFLQPNGTTQILGNNTSFENTNLQSIHTGVVQLNGTGVVNLSHSGNLAATVTLNGGAIVLDAVSSTSSVKLDGSTFSTNSYQPIAFHQPMPPLEELYTADDNSVIRTRFAEIRVRKGSVMTISSHDGLVRITSLSGSLSVLAGGRSMEVHNGEELIVSDHRLTLEEQTRSDGVGRRNFQTFPLAAGLHATVCDVSLVSLIRESQLLDSLRHPQTRSQKALAAKVLRNAAALHVVTQGRGAYQSRSKELRSGNGSENLTPVRYVR
jgi:filamentous hemagglutinin